MAGLLEHYEKARAEAGRAIRRQSNEHYMLKRLREWFTKLGTALKYACALLEIAHTDPVDAARPSLHHL